MREIEGRREMEGGEGGGEVRRETHIRQWFDDLFWTWWRRFEIFWKANLAFFFFASGDFL